MTLVEICEELLSVRDGLLRGEISHDKKGDLVFFTFSNLGEYLDEIIQPEAGKVIAGESVSDKEVKGLIKKLSSFNNYWQVKEVGALLRELRRYVQGRGQQS